LLIGNFIPITGGFAPGGDASQVADYTAKAASMNAVDMVLHVIPDTFAGAFAAGDILQVLLLAILFGFALMAAGERGRTLRGVVDATTHAIFGVIAIIVKVAPFGAFGALAYTVGKFGPAALGSLFELILLFFLTVCTFIVVVLGLVARASGFNLFRFLLYIRDEVFLTVAVGASEPAMPLLMEKLERLGCSKPVVGLVVPAGYSFNLDGTNIYMTLATLFISHALGVHLTLGEQLEILIVAMLTSKGASGVSGAGFITLAATLAVVNPVLVPGMAIVFGIDQFMSRCRGFTNIIGNGVACVVVSRWENELDTLKLARGLDRRIEPTDVETAIAT
jgi:aerobic C4-dicarboxylate transport protein